MRATIECLGWFFLQILQFVFLIEIIFLQFFSHRNYFSSNFFSMPSMELFFVNHFFSSNVFLTEIIFRQIFSQCPPWNYSSSNVFLAEIIFSSNFFSMKLFFLIEIIFRQLFFSSKLFFVKFFLNEIILRQKFFSSNVFLNEIILKPDLHTPTLSADFWNSPSNLKQNLTAMQWLLTDFCPILAWISLANFENLCQPTKSACVNQALVKTFFSSNIFLAEIIFRQIHLFFVKNKNHLIKEWIIFQTRSQKIKSFAKKLFFVNFFLINIFLVEIIFRQFFQTRTQNLWNWIFFRDLFQFYRHFI